MKKLIGTYSEIGYQHWASYIINGDASGLEDEDIAACDAWLEGREVIGTGDEIDFTVYVPGLPGAAVEYIFPIYEEVPDK